MNYKWIKQIGMNIINIQINICPIRTNWAHIYLYICNICPIGPANWRLICPIWLISSIRRRPRFDWPRFTQFDLPDLPRFAWFALQVFLIRPSLTQANNFECNKNLDIIASEKSANFKLYHDTGNVFEILLGAWHKWCYCPLSNG